MYQRIRVRRPAEMKELDGLLKEAQTLKSEASSLRLKHGSSAHLRDIGNDEKVREWWSRDHPPLPEYCADGLADRATGRRGAHIT